MVKKPELNNNDFNELKKLLDQKYVQYSQLSYFEKDPIIVAKRCENNLDIEIIAFLTSVFSWGQRPTIIKNGFNLLNLMENNPYEFLINLDKKKLNIFNDFKHRTFQSEDCKYFMIALKYFIKNHNSIGQYFEKEFSKTNSIKEVIIRFRKEFFKPKHERRVEKHLPDIENGSAGKRLNMFIRWMVRKDQYKIDFGLWKLPTSELFCPLDLHSGNTARKYGLLVRPQNDWKSVEELTNNLKKMDAYDPIKYDIALYGMGGFEKNNLIKNK